MVHEMLGSQRCRWRELFASTASGGWPGSPDARLGSKVGDTQKEKREEEEEDDDDEVDVWDEEGFWSKSDITNSFEAEAQVATSDTHGGVDAVWLAVLTLALSFAIVVHACLCVV